MDNLDPMDKYHTAFARIKAVHQQIKKSIDTLRSGSKTVVECCDEINELIDQQKEAKSVWMEDVEEETL